MSKYSLLLIDGFNLLSRAHDILRTMLDHFELKANVNLVGI
jgi:5'-3' exonuclease